MTLSASNGTNNDMVRVQFTNAHLTLASADKQTLLDQKILRIAHDPSVNSSGVIQPLALGDITKEEYEALLDFYEATGGPNWKVKNGWENGTRDTQTYNVLGWFGVSSYQGHVIQLFLSNNRLTGTIPSSFTELKYLTSVDLTYNSLSGQFPEVFKSLTQLKGVDLTGNLFSGPIPEWVGNMNSVFLG